MSTPDATAAVEAAVRWGQEYLDGPQGPADAAGPGSVRAHVLRPSDVRLAHSAAYGVFVHVMSRPARALDAIVVVSPGEDHLEAGISSWHLPCSVCGRMAGPFRAELGP